MMAHDSPQSPPLHVLIAIRELGIGGSERQACLVARLLDPRRFRVTVGCFVPTGLRREELDSAGIAVKEFPVRSLKSPGLAGLALDARRWMNHENVAVIHSWDYPTALFLALTVAPFKRIPLVSSLRSFRALIPQPYRSLLRVAETFSDRIVVNSSEVRDDLLRRERMAPSRLHLAYNAVDPDQFPTPVAAGHQTDAAERQRPAGLAGASIVIGCVSGTRVEKDLPTLMRAVAALRAEFPGLRLILVGSGPAEREIRTLRQELLLEDLCVLVPQTTNTHQWYAAMDIFVLPSLTEALSNAILEAMCSECAVVASDVGGNKEIIQSGSNGLLFPAGSVGALTKALRDLIANPSQRLALARAGRQSVLARFSPSAAANNLGALYDELTVARRSR